MFGLIAMAAAYVIAKALDDAGEYKPPVGKHKNRYR